MARAAKYSVKVWLEDGRSWGHGPTCWGWRVIMETDWDIEVVKWGRTEGTEADAEIAAEQAKEEYRKKYKKHRPGRGPIL